MLTQPALPGECSSHVTTVRSAAFVGKLAKAGCNTPLAGERALLPCMLPVCVEQVTRREERARARATRGLTVDWR